jgi:hypothetical protein
VRCRRTVPLAGVAALVPALAALAGSAPAQTAPGDSGFGSGHVLETDFVSSGHSGPNGENPVGTLRVSGYLNFTATATCSNVSGDAVVAGYRIETGRRAGRGFLSSSVDHGPPRGGRPVDETVYSGYVRRPPVNCPSPGDSPPPGFDSTGGGPFTSGDFTLVDARERLPKGTPPARITRMKLGLRPGRLAGRSRGSLKISARVCGAPGMALLRLRQASSPGGRDRPVDSSTSWRDQLRHGGGCEIHRISRLLDGFPGGRRYRVALTARTTGRRWSRTVVRYVDAR